MGGNFPLQKKLFDLVFEKSKDSKSRNWIRMYSKDMHLSKSAVYNRVNAQKSITFDEGISLMHQYKISFLGLTNDRNTNLSGTANLIQDYQSSFLRDLENASAIKDVKIWHFTNDLPLFLLKKAAFWQVLKCIIGGATFQLIRRLNRRFLAEIG